MLNDVIKKKEKNQEIHGDDKWLRGKWGEVSPTLINLVEKKNQKEEIEK